MHRSEKLHTYQGSPALTCLHVVLHLVCMCTLAVASVLLLLFGCNRPCNELALQCGMACLTRVCSACYVSVSTNRFLVTE
jgi:hypothetical protein